MLQAAAAAPFADIRALAPAKGLMVIAPHPDDETFGCGMALAAAVAAGRHVQLVLLTDGEASHPGSARFDKTALARLRSRELQRALQALSPQAPIAVRRLGQPDGASDFGAISQKQIDDLVGLSLDAGIGAIWSTWRHDPHCDHQTAAMLADRLAGRLQADLFEYAVWGRFGTRPVPSGMVRFEDPHHREAKIAATRSYRSQTGQIIDDDPTGFIMPPAFVEHFIDHPEIFFRAR